MQVAPGINVDDMAVMLEESFNASSRGGGRRRRGGQQSQLVITPDKRTNSVMLAGAPGLFDKVEAVIRQYEEMSPKGWPDNADHPHKKHRCERSRGCHS